MNRLYYGDCLTVMQEMPLACVDLIYLDPPFKSDKDYNAIYKDETGRPLPDQIEAFCDTWVLDDERERAIRNMPILMRESGIDDDVAKFWKLWMNALRSTQPSLLAYLSYMAQRLLVMKGLLKPTASIYLHCDPHASHYIKPLMDSIFGHRNFQNEIIWHYPNRWPARANKFQAQHDVILVYSASAKPLFNDVRIDAERVKKDIKRGWATDTVNRKTGRVRRLRIYDRRKTDVAFESGQLDPNDFEELVDQTHKDGTKPCPDVWTINFINPNARERLGYATQKPLELLERIICASSPPDGVIFDPFCGCATTIEAAHKLGRKWIGIDIAIHAVKRVAKLRLEERLKLTEGVDFVIEGIPRNIEGARDLWERDKYQFQKWAVELVDGFVTTRKTADGGIDGRMYFEVSDSKELGSMVLEVKGGQHTPISIVRDLRGVLERDDALMAGLIILEPLGERQLNNFKREMASAGDIKIGLRDYPRMQLLSVKEIMEGSQFLTPGVYSRSTGQQSISFAAPQHPLTDIA